jgi:hypothetical protein
MRILRAAAVMMLFIAPAYAQKGAPPAPTDPPKSQTQIESERAADKAYKNSLGNIPDKPAADPWGGARGLETTSKPVAKDPPAKRTKAGSAGN